MTIFGNQYMQWNPTKPMEALPLLIYNNSSQPYADLVQIAWGAALLLMVVVLVLSVGSRVLAARSAEGTPMTDAGSRPRDVEDALTVQAEEALTAARRPATR